MCLHYLVCVHTWCMEWCMYGEAHVFRCLQVEVKGGCWVSYSHHLLPCPLERISLTEHGAHHFLVMLAGQPASLGDLPPALRLQVCATAVPDFYWDEQWESKFRPS